MDLLRASTGAITCWRVVTTIRRLLYWGLVDGWLLHRGLVYWWLLDWGLVYWGLLNWRLINGWFLNGRFVLRRLFIVRKPLRREGESCKEQ
ncbi:hypothetical protein TanjilG_20055 [Lupinus angustifolius]|uniref:Uncharacterized protein n=1 Tax=Lupinus angustifolius TaxID=3871 RepID=A0A4P1RCK8_LUPAN|nr:hypothetical protein TanjilG_20055 [Lupinus angustifolius]